MSNNGEHFLHGDFQIVKKLKPTSAQMLRDCEVGDILQFKVVLKAAGSNRGTYATYICITNQRTEKTIEKSFNQLDLIYRAFKLEKC